MTWGSAGGCWTGDMAGVGGGGGKTLASRSECLRGRSDIRRLEKSTTDGEGMNAPGNENQPNEWHHRSAVIKTIR